MVPTPEAPMDYFLAQDHFLMQYFDFNGKLLRLIIFKFLDAPWVLMG
jgi:hypothetical protein